MGQALLDLPGLEKQSQKPGTEGTGGFVPSRGSDKPECSRSKNSWTALAYPAMKNVDLIEAR